MASTDAAAATEDAADVARLNERLEEHGQTVQETEAFCHEQIAVLKAQFESLTVTAVSMAEEVESRRAQLAFIQVADPETSNLLRSDLAARQGELDDAQATLSGFEAKMKQLDDTVSALSREKAEVESIIAEVASNRRKDSSASRGRICDFYKIVQSATYRLQHLKMSVQGDLQQALERKKDSALLLTLGEPEPDSVSPEFVPTEEASSSHIPPGSPVTGVPLDDALK